MPFDDSVQFGKELFDHDQSVSDEPYSEKCTPRFNQARADNLTVAASRSKTFRNMAADALRAGRKAVPGDDRDAHFSTAASYKSLAHDDEWLCKERQRSSERRPKK